MENITEDQQITLSKIIPDKRYTIALEYCGKKDPQYVTRFSGNWVTSDSSFILACRSCLRHHYTRLGLI